MADPKTPTQRSASYRERQAALGRKQVNLYVTDVEHEYLKIALEMLREDLPEREAIRSAAPDA